MEISSFMYGLYKSVSVFCFIKLLYKRQLLLNKAIRLLYKVISLFYV